MLRFKIPSCALAAFLICAYAQSSNTLIDNSDTRITYSPTFCTLSTLELCSGGW